MNKTFLEMDIGSIVTRKRFRKDMGDMTTLENSIRKLGLLYPVIVDRNGVLISGERRLAACRNVGISRIPVFQVDTDHDSLTALDIHSDMHLCRHPLSEQELHDLIESKKSLIPGPTSAFSRAVAWFRGLWSR